jgi:sporulation protein YlmC with PRC-barrel domain
MSVMRLDLDSRVVCADGPFGELADVVIDPGTRCVTHLVVQQHDRHRTARLVSIDRGRAREAAKDRTIALDCSIAEVMGLKTLETVEYVPLGQGPEESSEADVGIEEAFELPPYQSLGVNEFDSGMGPMDMDPHVTVTYDRIPKGTVELRRASDVTSSDGHHVGHVVGLVIEEHGRITQLVLEHGHLWRKREIVIPIGSVDRIQSDAVALTLTNDQAV